MFKNRKIMAGCLLITLTSFPLLSGAEDLGKYGSSWEIGEPDAIDSLKNKAKRLEADGTMRRREMEYRNKSIDSIKNPSPLPNISTAIGYRSRQFDPTYTYPESVKDETGRVLVPAGTRVNPLDYQALGKRLIFIDGRDKRQRAYAKRISDENPSDKIILTAGSFIELSKTLERRVYFDQRGILTTHFGISFVPAVLTQTGGTLKIEEGYKNAN